MPPQDRAATLKKCMALKEEINKYDSELFEICIKFQETDEKLQERSEEDEYYLDTVNCAISLLEGNADLNASNIPNINPIPLDRANKLKLPQVPFPEFSNKKG